jgi:hypothetical protein
MTRPDGVEKPSGSRSKNREEQGAVAFGFQHHHVADHLGRQQIVQAGQIAGLARQSRSVIDQLERQAFCSFVEFGHFPAPFNLFHACSYTIEYRI